MLLVQVVKDCRGTKGPGVTRNVTLPGRYIVLEPFGNRISLSRKITCKSLRTRLRTLVQKSLPEGMGVVIRTAAAKAAAEEIENDLRQLLASWQVLLRRSKVGEGPAAALSGTGSVHPYDPGLCDKRCAKNHCR